jgi:hypothetical protein
MSRDRGKPDPAAERQAREARLAAALRANLRRRKASAADDSAEPPAPPVDTAPDDDPEGDQE